MKISIVTAVYNRRSTIGDAIQSIARQTYKNIEYIVIDGNSNDGTDSIVEEHRDSISISIRESDKGIYDALNKGINAATGDVIGFLHADDLLYDQNTIRHIADCFNQNSVDATYGDLLYVNATDISKTVRYWKSGEFHRNKFRWGWMPPHPTVYIRKSVYQDYGNYRIDLGSAADYEAMVRLLYRATTKVKYIPSILLRMRLGGESNASFSNRVKANQADRDAWIENGLKPPFGLRLTKPFRKIPQYFLRPKGPT